MRVWRNYYGENSYTPKLVTAWQILYEMLPSTKGNFDEFIIIIVPALLCICACVVLSSRVSELNSLKVRYAQTCKYLID